MGFDAQAGGPVPGGPGSFSKITLPTGAAGAAGTSTLSSGTVTVSTTAVTASSIIVVTVNTPAGATQGVKYKVPTGSITAGTSFVITAVDNTGATVATDTSTVNWVIFN
jgi:hypothetical protein